MRAILEPDFKGFEWDVGKAASNFRKHRITFEEAAEALSRPYVERDSAREGEARKLAVCATSKRLVAVIYMSCGATSVGSYPQELHVNMRKENIVRYSLNEIREKLTRGEGKSDWARVDAMADAEIEAQMRDDPDWADFIDIDWSKARVVYPVEKQAVSIRLDRDVLDFFKAGGKGYQTRINAVLRGYMEEIRKLKDPAE